MSGPPAAGLVVADQAAWRAWLAANAASGGAVWVAIGKKAGSEETTLDYDGALDEAICFGWVDGLVRRRNETTTWQRFSARRPRSHWSDGNVARARRLTAEGRMTALGRAALERR